MNGAQAHTAVAYFSMEIGLDASIPTYSGGLGVLAGDTLKAAADLGLPMVATTLLHRKGYFTQRLLAAGDQVEGPTEWLPSAHFDEMPNRVRVRVDGEEVAVRCWRYVLKGYHGDELPVYFLDTDLPENSPMGRSLTDYLYGGDARYRLSQEVVLGIGGVAMLRSLGYSNIRAFHMNEGHSALLTVALLEEQVGGRGLAAAGPADQDAVRGRCVFTTHTPVPAGHDQFPHELACEILGDERADGLRALGCCVDHKLNMTYLALTFSRYVNGVAMRHGQVSRGMFPNYPIASITNGVHVATWTSKPIQALFDEYIPRWRADVQNLRYAVSIPLEDIRRAHAACKAELIEAVNARTGTRLDPNVMTIGYARRAATYKRADLIFQDLDRLRAISNQVGPIQLVYAGKAHPRDAEGKAMIRRVFEAAEALRDSVPVVYLENYDMEIASFLIAGVDLWLNTPQKPQEASGTSGMKAAINGVPSLSVLDGWWVEGHVEGVTGWSIGDSWEGEGDVPRESADLHDKLARFILPLFYGRPSGYAQVMRSSISLNGSFFNARRMVLQYRENAYRL